MSAPPPQNPAANNGRAIPTEVKDPGLVARRRRQIVDAAVKLFIAKGFHKTTTREIAKAAGISIGSLYEYIQAKEDVLYLVCEAIHLEMEQRLKDRLIEADNGAQALAAAVETYFQVCGQMSDHILLIYQETKSLPKESMRYVLAHDERIAEIFAGLLRKGADDGSLRQLSRQQINLVAADITVMGHMWTFRNWSLRKHFDLKEYTLRQSALLLRGLVREEETKRLGEPFHFKKEWVPPNPLPKKTDGSGSREAQLESSRAYFERLAYGGTPPPTKENRVGCKETRPQAKGGMT